MRERGLDVDHSTVFRWVQRYAPEINKRIRQHLKMSGASYPEVKPYSVANDFGRKTVATIERRGGMHRRIMPQSHVRSTLASLS